MFEKIFTKQNIKKIKKIERKLFKLEKCLSKLKKYHDYDDIEYKGIRDVKNWFNLSTDEDYYTPISTNSSFDDNYIEHEIKGDKKKTLSIKEYLNMIKPYLRDLINDHKTQGEWKVCWGNPVIYYKTHREWRIQLIMIINFISSKDSDEISTMRTTSNNIEIMMGNEADEITEKLFYKDIEKD